MATTPNKKTVFKIILLGEANVGKTSLFHRVKTNTFSETTPSTITSDYLRKRFTVGQDNVTIQLWDTAGFERQHSMPQNYYKSADAIIYVYSVDNTISLLSLNKLDSDVRLEKIPDRKVLKFVIGNKTDLQQDVNDEHVEDFCSRAACTLPQFKTSAKEDGQDVNDIFETIVQEILETPPAEWDMPAHETTVNPSSEDSTYTNASCGC